MKCRQRPRPLSLAAFFRSPFMSFAMFFATPHPLHDRRSTQSLHTRLSALVFLTPLANAASDFQSRQRVHSNGVPGFVVAFTQSTQNLRSSLRLNCKGANLSLKCRNPQPVRYARGVCFSSIAFYSTGSPRSTRRSSTLQSGKERSRYLHLGGIKLTGEYRR